MTRFSGRSGSSRKSKAAAPPVPETYFNNSSADSGEGASERSEKPSKKTSSKKPSQKSVKAPPAPTDSSKGSCTTGTGTDRKQKDRDRSIDVYNETVRQVRPSTNYFTNYFTAYVCLEGQAIFGFFRIFGPMIFEILFGPIPECPSDFGSFGKIFTW